MGHFEIGFFVTCESVKYLSRYRFSAFIISQSHKFLNFSKRYLTSKAIFKADIFERVELLIGLTTRQMSRPEINGIPYH